MSGVIDIPYTKAFVSNELILGTTGWTKCYLFAVTSFLNRPLLFTIHTEHGAVYSRVPLHLLRHEVILDDPSPAIPDDLCDPWGCLGERVVVTEHAYLRNYEVQTKLGISGRYLFSFDWLPQGHLEEDPEQQKSMNLLALSNGQFALLPNNKCLFLDAHFTGPQEWPRYQRNTEYWRANG